MKSLFPNKKFTLAVILGSVVGAIFIPVQVQPQQPTTSPDVQQTPPNESLIFNQPQAATKPAPGRRRGGGTYGGGNQCPSLNPPLTALVPGTEEASNTVSASRGVRGLTAEGYPTIWFYVPFSEASKLSAKFVLVNDKDELVYQQTFPLTRIPGIMKLRPDSTSMPAPLEVGKDYRWSFSIICNPQDSSANTYVEGLIQRIELNPNLTAQLKTATPQQKAVLYAQAGLWHETITAIIEEVRPTDSKKATLLLSSLLQSVGLNDIAQQPILQ